MNGGTFTVRCYLVIGSNGQVRAIKSKPNVNFDEIAVGLTIEVPRMLFEKPNLEARLTIPEGAAPPVQIPVEVMNNMKEAIESASGMRVELSMGGER